MRVFPVVSPVNASIIEVLGRFGKAVSVVVLMNLYRAQTSCVVCHANNCHSKRKSSLKALFSAQESKM